MQNRIPTPRSSAFKWLAALAAFALAVAGCSSTAVSTANVQTPKNIIIMFADGVAPTQWDFGRDRKSTRLNSSHIQKARMPSSA